MKTRSSADAQECGVLGQGLEVQLLPVRALGVDVGAAEVGGSALLARLRLGEGLGAAQAGQAVGLILWGTTSYVSGLEIYSLAVDPPFELPRPDSVSDVPPGFAPGG